MNPEALAEIISPAVVLAGLAGFCAGAFLAEAFLRSRHPTPSFQDPPSAPREAHEHVHTFQLSSVEETGGKHIHVYRCVDCGTIQRWITPRQE
jgi:hypothetical protein